MTPIGGRSRNAIIIGTVIINPEICDTPYCNWSEVHCSKCGVYRKRCCCGFSDSLSLVSEEEETVEGIISKLLKIKE